MTLANQLTLLRIFLIPLLVGVFYLPYDWRFPASSMIFSLAAITDWLDGWVARNYNQTTAFGAFLDPVADKLMVAVALVLLVEVHHTPWFAIPAVIIIGREIVISALREWMAELGKRASVAVSMMGKIKTTVQMTAIIVLLFDNPDEPSFLTPIGYVALYVAAALTLWSMIVYLKAAWPDLKPTKD
jgi:CDP-diacylglycerol--glycerol-3-phosphate 3-phosphatidyltransferase